MKKLTIPMADSAERAIGALSASNPVHVQGLHAVAAEDFRIPAMARLFEGRDELAGVAFLDDRIDLAARLSGLSVQEIRRMISELGTMWRGERYAREVHEAAERRRIMAPLAKAYADLATGASVKDVRERLGKLA